MQKTAKTFLKSSDPLSTFSNPSGYLSNPQETIRAVTRLLALAVLRGCLPDRAKDGLDSSDSPSKALF